MLNIIKITDSFTDARGAIARIMELSPAIKSALYITSKTGSVRANHYHKHDTHYTFLLTGKFAYLEKGIRNGARVEKRLILPGDLVTTPAKRIHAMKFQADSTMVVFTTEPRDQTSYEADTVRIKLV